MNKKQMIHNPSAVGVSDFAIEQATDRIALQRARTKIRHAIQDEIYGYPVHARFVEKSRELLKPRIPFA